jgi:hypothetical protein
MKATPTAHLSHPPSGVVTWYYKHRAEPMVYHLQAKTWFEARAKAMCALGCGQEAITVWQSKSLEGDVESIWSEAKKCTP